MLAAAEAAPRGAGVSRPNMPLQTCGLLRPRSTGEVSEILRRCDAAGQRVTVHGGMSGGGGNSCADELAISLERMAAIEEIDTVGRTAVIQAGCLLQHLHDALAPHGLAYGVDYGGRGSATLGGNISTNAGGLQVLRYGMTREQVLGLEVVLADGTVLSSMNRMLKNNAGYDLKQLFIGTEGTLGVVTRAVLRLRALPTTHNAALVALASFADVARLLALCEASLAGTLTAFEVMWQGFYQGATQGHAAPLPASHPFYVLVETQGGSPGQDEAQFQRVMEQALADGLIADAVLPASQAQREEVWAVRERVMWIMKAPSWHIFDISLPIPHMERYVSELEQTLARRWPGAQLVVFGHIADGNLHVFVRFSEPQPPETYAALCELAYAPLTAIGGSMAAEHGVGRGKVPFLHYSRTEAELALMRTLKRSLDPKHILNLGRVINL
jgi:FAD/FMN-containing dehydrogenase